MQVDNIANSTYNTFTAASISNQGTLYLGTAAGCIYAITSLGQAFSTLPTPVVSCGAYESSSANAVLTLSANQNTYDYVLANNPYTTLGTGTSVTTFNSDSSNSITAIALATNDIAYYGTLSGALGAVGDNNEITPLTSNSAVCDKGYSPTGYCPISQLALTSNNAASGKKGVVALQLAGESLPVINFTQIAQSYNESGVYSTAVWPGFNFGSSLACLVQDGSTGVWTEDKLTGIPQTESIILTTESATLIISMPQYITAMSASTKGTVYVGTNLFNIYSNPNPCNGTWTQVNTEPLSTLQNGSVGITSIAMASSLFVTSNTTESIINVFQQN